MQKYSKEEIEQAYKDGATIKFKLEEAPVVKYSSVYDSSRVKVTWKKSSGTSYTLDDITRRLTNIWNVTKIEIIPSNTNKPHPKADLLKLYADGVELEYSNNGVFWSDVTDVTPWTFPYYRVKPRPKTKKVKVYRWVAQTHDGTLFITDGRYGEDETQVNSPLTFIQKIDSSEEEVEVEVK